MREHLEAIGRHAHFANLLTDGRLLYFADFGLSLSSAFELSPAEAEFLSRHLAYDRCHTMRHLLHHHLSAGLFGGLEPEAFLRAWIAGHRPAGVPREIAAIIDRHVRAAPVMGDFARRLLTESKRTPFPAADLERARGTTVTAPPHSDDDLRPGARDGTGGPCSSRRS